MDWIGFGSNPGMGKSIHICLFSAKAVVMKKNKKGAKSNLLI